MLAFLNIVGNGMRGGKFEHDLADMEVGPTGEMAKKYKGTIVGIKTAHYAGPEWAPVERAVEAGTAADIPVMVDFGSNQPEAAARRSRDQEAAARRHLHAHVLGPAQRARSTASRTPGVIEGRKRGVIFDVGHGGGSFLWRVAVPMVKDGFLPDSISTDLHIGSMNAGMKDMLNVMSKFLALGLPLDQVIRLSTWNPAREIKQEDLGHLSPGRARRRRRAAARERASSASSTCTARAWRAASGSTAR